MKRILLKPFLLILLAMSGLNTHAFDCVVDGIYYDLDSAKATVTNSKPYSGAIKIPETITYNGITYSVTSIGDKAFYGFLGLTSVTIPSSVTSIGNYAFYGCSGLTTVTIPSSVTSIGIYAFYGCSGLTTVTIPNSVTSIGSSAFYGTPWYNNQPDGVVYVGKVAYKYKGTMPENTQITIKDGTLSIGDGAFLYCSRLTSVTIPNSVTSIGSYAFGGCI